MTPYARPIQTLDSVDEFIIVIADITAVYVTIAQRRDILHQNVSSLNMMYTRDSDGGVHGLLVDFDNVKCGNVPTSQHPFTGLLPFPGIQDLRSSLEPRSVLDGCESILYILC